MRAYLAEFLSDRRVVKLPRLLWLPLLHGIILPRRSRASAEKYAAIWTANGSPLDFHTREQARLLRDKTGWNVEYAMRYGQPSIGSQVSRFKGDFVAVPLYPQYSESTTDSVADVLPRGVRMVQDFHSHPGYIGALAAGVRRYWQANGRAPVLLMSFHGLPKRGAGQYEAQCRATARLLATELELKDAEWVVTFQSRFGYAEWLGPYTEATLVELARKGTARIDVFCPGFVSDCLETLEEIGIRGREVFQHAGGREFHLIPCLNESPEWIAALAEIARSI